jgi:23S rRNA (guanine2445-N2)-methyltransferase / 23S rRNA (guanine2069-N7)-methyltransferase
MAHTFTITCSLGTEELLVKELRSLGISRVHPGRGAVRCTGQLKDAYTACLWSRVGIRVLWQVGRFQGTTPDELYDGLHQLPWHEHIPHDGTLWVDFRGRSKMIRNEPFGAQKSKDAIVDQIRARRGSRPDIAKMNPSVRVNIRLQHGLIVAHIDLSGRALHERTPGKHITKAPLKENLAASLLMLADWPKRTTQGHTFMDPMCGSGTIVLEAAGMAANLAPGLAREHWGFQGWLMHNQEAWRHLTSEAADAGRAEPDNLIYASDMDPEAVAATQRNVTALGFEEIRIQRLDALEVTRPKGPPGILVVNPPYGTRLGDEEELVPLYGSLGDLFKKQFTGWDAFVFCPANQLSKSVGLKAARRHVLMNGPLDCRLLHFPIQ